MMIATLIIGIIIGFLLNEGLTYYCWSDKDSRDLLISFNDSVTNILYKNRK